MVLPLFTFNGSNCRPPYIIELENIDRYLNGMEGEELVDDRSITCPHHFLSWSREEKRVGAGFTERLIAMFPGVGNLGEPTPCKPGEYIQAMNILRKPW
jgi:hypothetical protein